MIMIRMLIFYESFNCEYYIEDTFNDLVSESSVEKHLSLLHLNTRSLNHNFDKVTNLLSTLKLGFSIIGISETWLKDSTHLCDIPGYNYIHEHRKGRTGGGVGLYLDKELEFKCRPDLCISNDSAESLFVEIIRKNEKNIIVGVIYRPPEQNVNDFCVELEQLLSDISKNNKFCALLGDWNLDLMKHGRHKLTAEFLDIMYAKMFFSFDYASNKNHLSYRNFTGQYIYK